MASGANQQAAGLALSIVLNSLSDHYNKAETKLSAEEYWRKRFKLTGVQSVDSYIQDLVDGWVDEGFTVAHTIASKVKGSLGI